MATERILILDDEPDVTKSWVRILGSTGYQCLATTDPQEAIRLPASAHSKRRWPRDSQAFGGQTAMTMLLMIGTFVASISWLLAWARLEAQQVKSLRVTRHGIARGSETGGLASAPARIIQLPETIQRSGLADYPRGAGQ
jgi:CheY-like chemotaxis protein